MGFPLQTRIVAVSNGSGNGLTQPFIAGEQAVDFYYSDLVVDLRGDIWAVPNQENSIVFHGLYNTIIPMDEVEEQINVSNTLPWDNAPGGDSPTFWEIAEEDPGYGDILCIHDDHCFIPTISSLCITNTDDPFFNVHDNIESVETPFDRLYYPAENQEHAEITPESYQWFKLEIHNFAPHFDAIPYQEAIAGNLYSYQVSASDTNYWNSLSFAAIELPAWLEFDSETGTLTGTPNIEHQGLNHVVLEVNDGLLTDTLEFEINVLNSSDFAQIIVSEIQVYPNPCTDDFYVDLKTDIDWNLTVMDINGREVQNKSGFGNFINLSLSENNPGIYFIYIEINNQTIRKKLVRI